VGNPESFVEDSRRHRNCPSRGEVDQLPLAEGGVEDDLDQIQTRVPPGRRPSR
jgi:hypothetical protein